jgi:TRAP-type transport system periplasmic protein
MAGWKAVLAVLGGITLAVSPASAQPEIRFGHIGEPGSLFDRLAQEFVKRSNTRVGSRAKVLLYGASQLGGDTNLMQRLRLGTVDLALPSTVMSSHIAEFGLFEMPYLVKDRAHMERVREQIVVPMIVPAAAAAGYRVIAVWENGFRHITTSKRPIVRPDDLKGLKLRVPQGGWRVKMFQAYGAEPTAMAFSEVYAALQTGRMDAQENPLAQIYPARFQDVQKYLSLTSHVYTPAYLTAGASWARLPTDVQEALVQTGRELQPIALALAATLDRELLNKLRDAGLQINEADRAAFGAASKPIYEEFARDVPDGKALIDRALALAASP